MEKQIQQEDKKPATKEPKTFYYSGKLFHGASSEFDFDKDFFDVDWAYKKSAQKNDSWTTLGQGLYFTDDLESSKKYSSSRSGNEHQQMVYSAVVPECKFLDFRSREGNLPVPKDIVGKWIEKLKLLVEEKYPDVTADTPRHTFVKAGSVRRKVVNTRAREVDHLRQYTSFLKEVNINRNLDLREMLGTAPAPRSESSFQGALPSAKEGVLFRKFVLDDLGYDGIIYNERKEWNKDNLSSYVVYNLEKIKYLKRT